MSHNSVALEPKLSSYSVIVPFKPPSPMILSFKANVVAAGTVGFVGTSYFVKKIYSTVKID